MVRFKKAFIQISLVFIALLATAQLLASFPSPLVAPVLAQSPDPDAIFPLPDSLPSGTTIKVNGSNSMKTINEALKKRFTEKYPGVTIELAAGGTDEALAALLRGEINLAAVGRELTTDEKAQGLEAVHVSREKIATIVGANNPFRGDLTFDKFAKIFRGEITDWSELGGTPGAVRFIDHPKSSDTRRSLYTYDHFQRRPFESGANAVQLSQEDTATIVQALGNDGISYAIADQVINLDNVRVLSMHGTLPDDARYPYSQPRGYVYQKGTTNPGVRTFLGFATSVPGQEIVKEAREQEAENVRQATATNSSSETSSDPARTSARKGETGETGRELTNQELSALVFFTIEGLLLVGLCRWLLD